MTKTIATSNSATQKVVTFPGRLLIVVKRKVAITVVYQTEGENVRGGMRLLPPHQSISYYKSDHCHDQSQTCRYQH